MNDTDLASRIDRSFGDGPAPRPVEDHLRSGRRALRRRRVAGGAGALAVLAVVGTGLVVGGLADGSPTGSPTDTGPAVERTESVAPSNEPASAGVRETNRRWWVGFDGADGGTVVLGRDVRLLERIDDPLAELTDVDSVAVAVARGDMQRWVMTTATGYTIASRVDPAYADLSAWTDDMVASVAAGGGLPELGPATGEDEGPLAPADLQELDAVEFGQGEQLVATRDDVTISEQQPSPDLPERFAGPGDRTAVALLSVDTRRIFVLARVVDGPAEYVYFEASADTGPVIDTFLDFAAKRYTPNESGGSEGLR